MAHTRTPSQAVLQPSFGIRILIGAGIALLAISVFVFGGKANPEWGEYWMIRPLIVTPLMGAIAGACTYFMDYLQSRYGWYRPLIVVLNIVGYVIGLWMGIVLGLAGTMWN